MLEDKRSAESGCESSREEVGVWIHVFTIRSVSQGATCAVTTQAYPVKMGEKHVTGHLAGLR